MITPLEAIKKMIHWRQSMPWANRDVASVRRFLRYNMESLADEHWEEMWRCFKRLTRKQIKEIMNEKDVP